MKCTNDETCTWEVLGSQAKTIEAGPSKEQVCKVRKCDSYLQI